MSAERARAAVLGVFVADAAACGLHWFYDVETVRRRGGDAPEFQPPENNRYHSRRAVGRLTHYGDQALIALESIAACGGLDADDYRRRLVEHFGAADYDGYLDHAMKDLLATGRGSDDDHAGCFACLAPLVARYGDDPELPSHAEKAIRVTHDNVQAVQYGLRAVEAIRAAAGGATPAEAVAAAGLPEVAAAGPDHVAYALERGQTCPAPNSLPVALHAVQHGADFKDTVRLSILAGGDSSGRLLVAGAVRGSTDGVPEEWLARLVDRERIEAAAAKL